MNMNIKKRELYIISVVSVIKVRFIWAFFVMYFYLTHFEGRMVRGAKKVNVLYSCLFPN